MENFVDWRAFMVACQLNMVLRAFAWHFDVYYQQSDSIYLPHKAVDPVVNGLWQDV